jgi:hypothetical protein
MDDAALKATWKYQREDEKKWKLAVPAIALSNVNEVTRAATREVDPQPEQESWIPWPGIAVMSVCAAVLFLALYFGWLDWIQNLF